MRSAGMSIPATAPHSNVQPGDSIAAVVDSSPVLTAHEGFFHFAHLRVRMATPVASIGLTTACHALIELGNFQHRPVPTGSVHTLLTRYLAVSLVLCGMHDDAAD